VKIGIGIPNAVPGTPGSTLIEWAKRAEDRGFHALATIDRFAYPTNDALTTLAAAGAVTSRIGLLTDILLAPAYEPVHLAKVTATVDQLSNGRLTLGLAPGGREDDYTATGRDFAGRGAVFDDTLSLLRQAWRGQPVGGVTREAAPTPVREHRVPILVGGSGERAVRRTAEWGDGWTSGGAPPEQAAAFIPRIQAAWAEARRDGEPRLAALAYYSLGDDAEAGSLAYLRDYYGFLGPYADTIAAGALRSEQALKGAVSAFADAGFTEFYLMPTYADPDQVHRLADAVL
jgi:alkanesulfonate monooxygenase SsuD/methylene tetrahydromethanopterin reductase-like flavin-dependent oxidoreductase (luciferase family)